MNIFESVCNVLRMLFEGISTILDLGDNALTSTGQWDGVVWRTMMWYASHRTSLTKWRQSGNLLRDRMGKNIAFNLQHIRLKRQKWWILWLINIKTDSLWSYLGDLKGWIGCSLGGINLCWGGLSSILKLVIADALTCPYSKGVLTCMLTWHRCVLLLLTHGSMMRVTFETVNIYHNSWRMIIIRQSRPIR